MVITIEHQPTWLGKLYGFFLHFLFFSGLRKSGQNYFWQTQVNAQGILVSRRWAEPVFIPWSRIKCLDLSGLERRHLSSKNLSSLQEELNKRFFVLIMSDDAQLLRKACCSARKTWLAASNVLGLIAISPASALKIKGDLEALARRQGINLDTICLDI